MIDDSGTYYPDEDDEQPVIPEPLRQTQSELEELLKKILQFNITAFRLIREQLQEHKTLGEFAGWEAMAASGEEQNIVLLKLFYLEKDCKVVVPAPKLAAPPKLLPAVKPPLTEWEKFMFSIGADEAI